MEKFTVDYSHRIYSFDLLKILCSFMVCIIHWSAESDFYYLVPVRIAVPCFVLISGYFMPSSDEKFRKQLKKLVLMLIATQAFYFCFYCAIKIVSGTLHEYIASLLTKDTIFDFLVFNRAVLGGHTWYIACVIYAMIIVYFLLKWNMNRLLIGLSMAGLAVLLIFGKYSPLIVGVDCPTYLTKTYYCIGIPFLAIGYFMRRYKDRVIKKSNGLILIIFLISLICGFVEKFILQYFDVEGTRDFYISTIILSVAILAIAVKNPGLGGGKFLFLCQWGKKYSMMIYLAHIAVITVLKKLVAVSPITASVYSKIGFVFVFFVSFVIAIILENIKLMVKSKYKG